MQQEHDRLIYQPVADRLNRLLEQMGVKPLSMTLFDSVVHLADAYLQLTVPSFEFPREFPRSVHFVGTPPIIPNQAPLPSWAHELHGSRTIALVVTSGGYGSGNKAMGFGIPLVTAGLTEDKADVNARVAWSGVGITLATNEPTPQALRAAVRAVLDTPNCRSRASLMAAEFEAMDTRSEIVRIVDRIPRSANRQTQQHCAPSCKPSGALGAGSRRATEITQYPNP